MAAGLSQQKVADRFGISRAAVAQWEAEDTNPGTAKLEGVAEILGVRIEWLTTGRGPIGAGETDPHDMAGRALVPVIDYVRAGHWSDVVDPYEPGSGSEFLATDVSLGSNAFALVIDGESMAPEFQAGDKIIVDPDVTPRPGDFVVAKLDGEEKATFKKYRPRGRDATGQEVIELRALNEDWPALAINAQNPGRVVATMIEHRRYRRA
ncbi:MAG: helix-turn-helix domain-containing protein [Rhodospirillaceae bacterium]|nr:helix-turn-helix domain-containing protein [Rhodospirillaceae bacterium]